MEFEICSRLRVVGFIPSDRRDAPLTQKPKWVGGVRGKLCCDLTYKSCSDFHYQNVLWRLPQSNFVQNWHARETLK